MVWPTMGWNLSRLSLWCWKCPLLSETGKYQWGPSLTRTRPAGVCARPRKAGTIVNDWRWGWWRFLRYLRKDIKWGDGNQCSFPPSYFCLWWALEMKNKEHQKRTLLFNSIPQASSQAFSSSLKAILWEEFAILQIWIQLCLYLFSPTMSVLMHVPRAL